MLTAVGFEIFMLKLSWDKAKLPLRQFLMFVLMSDSALLRHDRTAEENSALVPRPD